MSPLLLFGEVEEVDGLGLGFSAVLDILEDDAWGKIPQQELLQLHLFILIHKGIQP